MSDYATPSAPGPMTAPDSPQDAPPGSDVGGWLRWRAAQTPEALAYRYLHDGESESSSLTYAQLDAQARAVAAWLRARGRAGDRVLLAHAPGPAFLPAFFGCLYAGMVAVPAYPPRRNGHFERLRNLFADSGARLALCDGAGAEALRSLAAEAGPWQGLQWNDADPAGLPADPWTEPAEQGPDALAFLQYTSGSTGDAKGVMVRHGNLAHNLGLMQRAFGLSAASRSVSWLPVFHDMGLILGVLQPLYSGFPGVLMPPNAFLQRPRRWLEAMSRYQATLSMAPDFAYRLCVDKIPPAERAGLDLSHWACAVNGAEPVRRSTLRAFSRAFRAQGFRARSFCPAYGLAEGTLYASGGPVPAGPGLLAPPSRLPQGEAAAPKCWSASGRPQGQDLRLVDPETKRTCGEGEVGEIWIRGASVAGGYWQKPAVNAEIFEARTAEGEGPFLRTGDLGYLRGGRLAVCGRLKDLLILRGVNHFPQDLEATAQAVSPDLRPGCGAAFSVEGPDGEALVLVQELQRHPRQSPQALAEAVVQALALEHGVRPLAVCLCPPASVPKTSSGKIRRRACKAAFEDGSLAVTWRWPQAAAPATAAAGSAAAWALQALRAQVPQAPAAGLDAPFAAWALDSLQALSFKAGLEQRLGRGLSLEELYQAPSLAGLCAAPAAPAAECSAPLLPLAASFLLAQQAGLPGSSVRVELRGPALAEPARVRAALEALQRQHGALRTRFSLREGVPTQTEAAQAPALAWEEWTLPPDAAAAESLWSQGVQRLACEDPGVGRPMRAAWGSQALGEGRLALMFDHLAVDGLSVQRLLQDFESLLRGQAPAAAVGVVEGARRVLALDGAAREADLAHWQERLRGWDAFPSLPPGSGEAGAPAALASLRSDLPAGLVAALKQRAGELRVTPLALLAAAVAKLFAFWTRGERLVFNVAQHARPQGLGLEDSVGAYADILPLSLEGCVSASLAELAQRSHQGLLEVGAHGAASGVELARRVGAARGQRPQAFSPITLTAGSFLDWEGFDGFRVDGLLEQAPETWLDLMLFRRGAAWTLVWNHREDQISAARCRRLERQLLRLLQASLEATEPDCFNLLLEEEDLVLHQRLNAGAGQAVPEQAGALERFQAQVQARPTAVAVSAPGLSLSYADLDRRSNQLAWRLRALGAGPGKRVGILLPRGADAVTAILAVLKAGAAYLPMDPLYPAERLAFMAEDGQLCALIADPALAGPALAPGVPRLGVDAEQGPATALPLLAGPADAAYVIYTSGSTGRPKGVVVRHRELARLFSATDPWFHFGPQDVWTLFHSYAFDFSVWELWGALLYGGRLVCVPAETSRDPRAFYALLRQEGVTVLNQTPSAFKALMTVDAAAEPGERVQSLRTVVFGGEALDLASLRGWYQRHPEDAPRLVNMYGITETTVHVTYRPLGRRDAEEARGSLIGVPIPDLSLRLLDAAQRPVPVGVAGEIHVGGAGLAQGYWQRPDLTQQRFVISPWGRLYRSGDLARLLPDGQLEYLGRGDSQVKIRGYRVELGEVQAAVLAGPGVAEAAVLLRPTPDGSGRLAAYVVPSPGRSLDADGLAALRRSLERRLPEPMVPALCVVAQLPLTAHGKLDAAALPDPFAAATQSCPPADALEAELLALWQRVLGRTQAGVEDDFFASGGHSLSAAAFHAQALALGHGSAPLSAFLKRPTVRALAEALRQGVAPAPTSPAMLADLAPAQAWRLAASPAQAALWVAQQAQPDSAALHLRWAWRSAGPVDRASLRASLAALQAAQPGLRCGFHLEDDGQLWQRASAAGAPPLSEAAVPLSEAEALAQLDQAGRRPFDLEAGPLWRVQLLPLQDGGCLLGFCVHHLVFDQASFDALHQALAGAPRDGAADLAAWWPSVCALPQRAPASAPPCAWIQPAAAVPAQPQLFSARLDAGLSRALAELAAAEQSTPFALLCAAWEAVLATVTPGQRPVFRVPVSLRQGLQGRDAIAYGVAPLPLRLEAETGADLRARTRAAGAALRALQAEPAWEPGSLGSDLFVAWQAPTPGPWRAWGQDWRWQALPALPAKAALALLLDDGPIWSLSLEVDGSRVDLGLAQRLWLDLLRRLQATLPAAAAAAPALLRGRWSEPGAARTVVEAFHAQVEQGPERDALAWPGGRLDYQGLAQRVRRMAAALVEAGVQRGDAVGVHAAPGPHWVAALMACLEAGFVYLPLDPTLPAERLRGLLEDAGCAFVLSDRARPAGLEEPAGLRWLGLGAAWEHDGAYLRPPSLPGPEDAAYLIFTSGSTGRPRGVLGPHRALLGLAQGVAVALKLGPGDRVLQFVSIGFDASLEEVLPALCSGACLALPCRAQAPSPDEFYSQAQRLGATVLHLPAAYWHALMGAAPDGWAQLPACRAVLVGGEAPDPAQVERLRELRPSLAFFNAYGPTEAGVTASLWRLPADAPVPAPLPLGRPLPGVDLAVVDGQGKLCAAEQEGELWIAGQGLALRYLQPREGAFVEAAPDGGSAQRWYRSGDRASLDAQGQLRLHGRLDRQVKLSGQRFDLDGLEQLLRQAPGVGEAVVELRGEGPDAELCAWVSPRAGAQAREEELRAWLAARLPEAQRPRQLQVLAALPLNVNGKLDRRVLRQRYVSLEAVAPAAPTPPPPADTDLDAGLLALWRKVLGPRAGMDSDFFTEGGRSLQAVRLSAEAGRLAGRPLSLAALQAAPTPRRLAAWLRATAAPAPVAEAAPSAAAAPDGRTGQDAVWSPLPLPLSATQWVLLPPAGSGPAALHALGRHWQDLGPAQVLDLPAPKAASPEQAWQAWVDAAFAQVQQQFPRGPLALLGWSVGGLLAASLCVRLQAAGRELKRLVLVDTVLPDRLLSSALALQPGLPQAWLKQRHGGADAAQLAALAAAAHAAQGFRLEALPVPVSLAVSEQSARRDSAGAWQSWALAARLGLSSLLLPGSHEDLLEGDGAALLAQRLREDLAAAPAPALTRP